MADSFLDEEAEVGTSSEEDSSVKSTIVDGEDRKPRIKQEKKKRVTVESDDDDEGWKSCMQVFC
jgi:hypothetical protein